MLIMGVIIALPALLVGALMLYGLLVLPNTPEGWFAYHTGFAFPSDAQVIESRSDFTQGMSSESFATEGSGCYAFITDKATIKAWLDKSPPWQNQWSYGELTMANWYSSSPRPEYAVYYSQTGGAGSGHLLVLDQKTNTVSLHDWAW